MCMWHVWLRISDTSPRHAFCFVFVFSFSVGPGLFLLFSQSSLGRSFRYVRIIHMGAGWALFFVVSSLTGLFTVQRMDGWMGVRKKVVNVNEWGIIVDTVIWGGGT